jgi:hypothetical protein
LPDVSACGGDEWVYVSAWLYNLGKLVLDDLCGQADVELLEQRGHFLLLTLDRCRSRPCTDQTEILVAVGICSVKDTAQPRIATGVSVEKERQKEKLRDVDREIDRNKKRKIIDR